MTTEEEDLKKAREAAEERRKADAAKLLAWQIKHAIGKGNKK